jgi:hypothetical protein
MFGDLYDALSLLWSWRWPVANGHVTAVDVERIRVNNRHEARLAVAYEFLVGDDGPYTGESFWKPAFFSVKRVAAARRKVRIRNRVTVRYRPDDPSVNTLDHGVKALVKSHGTASDFTHSDSQGRLSSHK